VVGVYFDVLWAHQEDAYHECRVNGLGKGFSSLRARARHVARRGRTSLSRALDLRGIGVRRLFARRDLLLMGADQRLGGTGLFVTLYLLWWTKVRKEGQDEVSARCW
jgi:hypothetical protein